MNADCILNWPLKVLHGSRKSWQETELTEDFEGAAAVQMSIV